MFTIRVSLFSYCSIWIPVLELKTLKTRYANVSCAYKMSYLLTQLKLFSNVALGLWWCHHAMVMSLTGYDDSNGIKTCRPSPINNILMIVVFDWTILYILYTYSNSVKKSTSWEACNSSASQDIPKILWNYVHKNLLLLQMLCQRLKKNRKSWNIISCYKIWWKKGIRYKYLIDISSNTCTLWYTIFDIYQLLHFGTDVSSLGSHYNKGTGDGQNNGNSCERYTYLY